MPSLFDIGKSGLQAYRQSLAVTGQNIANVNTDGFKKREVGLEEVTGAGGGGSGYCESGGAGGTSQRQVDVTNVNSISVTIGNPGGGTNYSGCGGNGNSSSFGSYCSAGGGKAANTTKTHAKL